MKVPSPTLPRLASSVLHPPTLAGPYLPPGTEVGSYRIGKTLGEGGMAIVYEASHRVLPRRVALKVMRDGLGGVAARERVLREACVLADLHHPAIVEVHDAGVLPDGRAWLAMSIIDGITLADHLLVRGTLPANQVAELVGQLADALATAHTAGVVHRDLKPDNILLVDDAACPVRLIDWGIAQAAATGNLRLTAEGSTSGTPYYMAPEQARGHVVDGRCDVYSLGVVAYEALVGVPPFSTGNALEIIARHLLTPPTPVRKLAPATPAWLAALVMTMLAKEPAARPSMPEVAAALAGLRAVTPEIVIEMVAEMLDDEVDLELDTVIADLPLPPMRGLARGSAPHPLGPIESVIEDELL